MHGPPRLRPPRVASTADTNQLASAAQRDATRLAEETAALRREAADILRRSRSYRDLRRRELLLERRWYVAPQAHRR